MSLLESHKSPKEIRTRCESELRTGNRNVPAVSSGMDEWEPGSAQPHAWPLQLLSWGNPECFIPSGGSGCSWNVVGSTWHLS